MFADIEPSPVFEDGKWWYFYWGNKAKMLICRGKNNNISDLNKYLHSSGLYDVGYYYNKVIKFKGNFVSSLNYIYLDLFYGSFSGGTGVKKVISRPNDKSFRKYSLLKRNCLQTTIDALLKSPALSKKIKDYLRVVRKMTVPNVAYNYIKGKV